MSVSIKLYKNTTENNRLDKSSYLPEATSKTVTGSFRTPVDILNPTVLINLNLSDANKYNYMYIADFKRYYFITGIVLKSGSQYLAEDSMGLFEISGHVDVLYSYKTKITASNAFVARNQSQLNPYIRDPLISFRTNVSRTYKTFSGDPFNIAYDPSKTLPHDYEIKNFVFYISNQRGGESVPSPEPAALTGIGPFSQPNPYGNPLSTASTAYVMGYASVWNALKYLNSTEITSQVVKTLFGQTAEAIISLKVFPFDIEMHNTQNVEAGEVIMIGDSMMGTIVGRPIRRYYNQVFNFGSIDLTGDYIADFRSFEPFRTYELYLPYIGWVSLDASDVSGRKIGLKYTVDILTGDCVAIVFDYTDTTKIFKTEHGKCGFDVPITSSNALEVGRNNIMSLLTIGSSVAAGVATGGAGGIAMAAGGILGAGASLATNPYKQTGSIPASVLSFWMPSKPILVVTDQEATNFTHIAKYRGYACYKEYLLSTLSGYTEVETIHLENMDPATSTEVQEVEQLLKSGVIL